MFKVGASYFDPERFPATYLRIFFCGTALPSRVLYGMVAGIGIDFTGVFDSSIFGVCIRHSSCAKIRIVDERAALETRLAGIQQK